MNSCCRAPALSPLWIFLSIPLLILVQQFAQNLLAPFEDLGKFYLLVWKIFSEDILQFMTIFMIFLFNYGLALFLNAPPHVLPSSNPAEGTWDLWYMIEDLMTLGLVGTELPVNFGLELTDGGHQHKPQASHDDASVRSMNQDEA